MRGKRLTLVNAVKVAIVVAAATCAGGAVLALGGVVNPKLDLLAHFAPLWLLGCAGTLLLSASANEPFRAAGMLLSSVGILAAATLMAPEVLRSAGPQAPASAPGQLKIVQFNVWRENRDVRNTVEWLANQHADIMILEETTPEMQALLKAQPGWQLSCQFCKTVIVSQLPYRRPKLRRTNEERTVVSVSMAQGIFEDQHGTFAVLAAHNGWPTDWKQQSLQEEYVAKNVGRYPTERTILAGDFNSTPWSFSRRAWDHRFGLIRRERGVFSWPAGGLGGLGAKLPFPLLPIDHLYAGSGWATVSVRRGPKLSSDHYPLVVILAPVAPR